MENTLLNVLKKTNLPGEEEEVGGTEATEGGGGRRNWSYW
jgi:hypothetical protein